MQRSIISVLFSLAAVLAPAIGAAQFIPFPSAPEITYQGELEDNGVPVNGNVDLIFSFFDAETSGALLGATQVIGPVPVVDGRFTVAVPVEEFWFEQPAWIEIEVANPSGSAPFVLLTPRQLVAPAPRALIADSVAPGALFWEPATSSSSVPDIVYNEGFVGIGTSAPSAPLDVHDNSNGIALHALQFMSGFGDVAVRGDALASSGNVVGVFGFATTSPRGTGVRGWASAPTGPATGVHGISRSDEGYAIRAENLHATGAGRGIWAMTASTFGYAGFFEGGRNYFEGNIGVGDQLAPNYPIDVRGSNAAVRVEATEGSAAFLRMERADLGRSHIALGNDNSMFFNINASDRMVLTAGGSLGLGTQTPSAALDIERGGSLDVGARVVNNAGGVGFEALLGGIDGVGIRSIVSGGTSVLASTDTGTAVRALATLPSGIAIEAESTAFSGTSIGVRGTTSSASGVGIEGITTFDGVGVRGASQAGGIGVQAIGAVGGLALQADGNVVINGTLSKSAGSFRIDHPLDPKNRYLSHSFVESPDMMNIYNGNIVTDQSGFAEVEMPAWFDALNRDFRYQLTVIGSFARATIGQKLEGKCFVILTDEPNIEVSWQVTGIRDDPYARAHPIEVESDKPESQRGRYQFTDWSRFADGRSR